MKKLSILFLSLVAFTIFSVIVLRTPSKILYLLNWGEYISDDVVLKFEKEYNCQVVPENVTSSEIMYQNITSGTTQYDVAIPGDYVVRQLYSEGYLIELDCDNTLYPYLAEYETMFTDSLKQLMNEYMTVDGEDFSTYYMPYFWGAYSIVYNTNNSKTEELIDEYGFKALYDRTVTGNDLNIGMYDTSRWIVMSYLLSEDLDPNITNLENSNREDDMNQALIDKIVSGLMGANFSEFGNDSLKRNVATGTLDMCFTQLGDYFDALYLSYESGETNVYENYKVSVPETTVAFFDSMVIPTTSNNIELANAFINFMLNPENAYMNAQDIGYCPTLKSVCDLYRADALDLNNYYYKGTSAENSLTLKDFLDIYKVYLDPLYYSDKYYLLEPKSNNYLATCATIFNKLAEKRRN